jgi:hypothetical protein
MNQVTAARIRLDCAAGLPALLDVCYDAFEAIRIVLRHYQEMAGTAFPAFVLAAGAAADGRDQIADSASLPAAADQPDAAASVVYDGDWATAAAEVAELSDAIAWRLSAASADAAASRDRTACLHAARHAARIASLLSWAGRT